ncbi:MAG: hypothetical protein NT129_06710 [Candidatus Aenigmarchaeota archaeon]|nr:hypothetical protein [Candidatus Aenigmarchaeota archaeon]
MYIDRQTIKIGAGAGIGIVQTFAFREYLDQYPIPVISDFIPYPWNRWSTFGNILIGAVALGVTSFTGVLNRKNPTLNKAVFVYGLTVLLGGIFNGIWSNGNGLMRASAGCPSCASHQYIPPIAHYGSKARGFGTSWAIPPTTTPYNIILF